MAELPVLKFGSQAEWEKWLDENGNQADGVWLKYAKKDSGEITLNHTQAVETALCYGWIDSQAKTFDDKYYLQKFSPRRPRSTWSKINVERAEELIAAGRLKPAGLDQVEAAKADGRWAAAYAGQRTAEAPADFLEALAKNKKAAEFYETLNKANKYAIIWRLHHSKKPETRAANIERYVDMLADGQKFH